MFYSVAHTQINGKDNFMQNLVKIRKYILKLNMVWQPDATTKEEEVVHAIFHFPQFFFILFFLPYNIHIQNARIGENYFFMYNIESQMKCLHSFLIKFCIKSHLALNIFFVCVCHFWRRSLHKSIVSIIN